MYTIGSILSFIIAIFYAVKYYNEHINDDYFDAPSFFMVSIPTVIVSAALSWTAIATLIVVKATDYYYKKYYKKDQQ